MTEAGFSRFGRWLGAAALAFSVLPSAAHAQMSEPDVVVRMERLENHIRQLTGTIEQLQYRNQQLEQQLRRSQEDAEYRFQELGGRDQRPRQQQSGLPPVAAAPAQPAPGAIQPSAGGPTAYPGTAPAPARRSDVFDPNENPNAPGAPQPLGGSRGGPPPVIAAPRGAGDDSVGVQGGRSAGAPLDLSTLSDQAANDPTLGPRPYPGTSATPGYPAGPTPPGAIRQVTPSPVIAAAPPADNSPLPAPPLRNPNATGAIPQAAPQQQMTMAPSGTPRDEFALAQGYIQRKDYALAEDSFRAFLKKHPSDRLAGDAQYWLGESLFQRQRYRDAAEAFLNLSTAHAQSGRAPDGMLRLGQSLAALGEREAACATLAEVGRKYPKASNAVKQNVDREQKRVKC
ncbi:MAG: hypothetical protein QOD74_777 [Variibacter sp.]|jgi:tol-pal system protein YbgF|nr:hypothetical protein [Variibacter sp.]